MDTFEISARQRDLLEDLQKGAFRYFIDRANPRNGLVADSLKPGSPASIAAVGFALPAYAVGVEHGWIGRGEAAERTLAILRTFSGGGPAEEPGPLGYQGFFYHFLDMESGERAWQCELSTVDSGILLAGMLAAGAYFQADRPAEVEIRQRVDFLYRRFSWTWALNGGPTLFHGWTPEAGFLPYRWEGYDEALVLYALGLGAPANPLPADSYAAWTATFRWETQFGTPFLFAAPLFIHHFSHLWIDFRGIQDAFMQAHSSDYFENSRKAAYINRQHAIANPGHFLGYGENIWGISASEGPGQAGGLLAPDGRRYFGYLARGAPGPDDGTLSPWTVITSLPFAPEIALPGIEAYLEQYPRLYGAYGMMCSLNPSFPAGEDGQPGWFSDNDYGLNEGPVVLMIENFRNGFLWELMKRQPAVSGGLKRAGFRGGWLERG